MKSHRLKVVIEIMIIGCVMICGPLAERAAAQTHWHCGSSNLKWPGENIRLRAGKKSFPANTPSHWRLALLWACGEWNQAPGEFVFMSPIWNEQYVGRGNGENEIWFSRDQDLLDGKAARCFTRYNCFSNSIIEADVVFNADVAWSTSRTQATKLNYGGSRRTWGSTAIHEMGHALGLAHEDDTYNVMGDDRTHIHANNGEVRWYAGEDAGNGEVHLYGRTNTTYKNDLGVTHWKYSGYTGEYSTHTQCRIYREDDSPVVRESFNGWQRYLVEAGKTYKVQFTYENNGYYDLKAVDIAYYISTNDRITTADRLIGLATLDMNRNKAYTLAIHLFMPWDLTLGQTYYIGVIVDYHDTILEFSPANNATWIPIRMIKEIWIP
jgi:hypothetical protein